MINVYAEVEDAKYFHHKDLEKALTRALKKTSTWLKAESVRVLGRELEIRAGAWRKRIKVNRIDKDTGGIWIGINDLNLAYVRDYHQTATGVVSGDNYYHKAFAQVMSGSRELIWRRTGERRKVSNPYAKRSPNGTRKWRKSPPVEIVREEIADEVEAYTKRGDLERRTIEYFKEAFINELYE